jgi:hypothetical protein
MNTSNQIIQLNMSKIYVYDDLKARALNSMHKIGALFT